MEDSVQTKTWINLQNRDLRLAVTHPPANYFQQMILWTEQGKLWKFPIDNEQGKRQYAFYDACFLIMYRFEKIQFLKIFIFT